MQAALLIAAIILLFGLVSSMDFDDAVLAEAEYCEGVRLKFWPDFKNICQKP